MEHPFEGRHFINGHHAVGLRHLGAKRNHPDGEAQGLLRRASPPLGQLCQKAANRISNEGKRLTDAGPDRHRVVSLPDSGPGLRGNQFFLK